MIYSKEIGIREKEVFKVIKDIPYYSISNYGRIKVTDTINKFASTHLDKDGYEITTLKGKTVKVHRLVAQYFIENNNPKENTQINHKDENKANNVYTNLEWCNHKYNNNYGTKIERQAIASSNGKIIEYDINGNITNVYRSLEFIAKNIDSGTGIKDSIDKNTFNRFFNNHYYFKENEQFDKNRMRIRGLYSIKDVNNNIVLIGNRQECSDYLNITIKQFSDRYTCYTKRVGICKINNYIISKVEKL